MSRLFLLATLLLAVPHAHASSPPLPSAQRVKSIEPQVTTPYGQPLGFGSGPRPLLSVGPSLFFFAADAVHGVELWKTDGTEAGTVFVKDLWPGPNSGFGLGGLGSPREGFLAARVGHTLFFLAQDGVHGAELWKSDGTEAGTVLVKDVRSGPDGSAISQMLELNGTLYFVADDGAHGEQLWKSDGTAAGTVPVTHLSGGPEGSRIPWLRAMNGTLYFPADDGVHGEEPWKSDGTEAGTALVRDIAYDSSPSGVPYGSGPDHPVVLDGMLYFTATDPEHDSAVWKSDGTEAGTTLAIDPAAGLGGGYVQGLYDVGGTLLVIASNGLWKGTGNTPTSLLAGGGLQTQDTRSVGGVLFFRSGDTELWRSDGTPAGTLHLASLGGNGVLLGSLGATLYFGVDNGPQGYALWKSDGTRAGTVPVGISGLVANFSLFDRVQALGERLYFTATDSEHGPELWKTDGTPAGTSLVKDLYPGPRGAWPTRLTRMGGKLYFSATDAEHGAELWSSDGTGPGTVLVKDIRSGPDSALVGLWMLESNGKLLFTANDGMSGAEPWTSDGTPAGTQRLADLYPGEQGSMLFFRPVSTGGKAFFMAKFDATPRVVSLVTTDGTAAGTVRLWDFQPSPLFYSTVFLPDSAGMNGTAFFFANDGEHGVELWKSDGTAAGTLLVKDLRPGPDGILASEPTDVNGTLFFHRDDVPELWKSDGTEAGTVLVKRMPTRLLTNVNGTLFFVSGDGAAGWELWKSDGTEAGTVRVRDIRPGPESAAPTRLVNVNGTLYFVADDGAHGPELWKSDGTEAGTVLVADVRPGPEGSGPDLMTAVDGALYFAADDGAHGWELWMTDGAAGGTRALTDIEPGPGSSGLQEPPVRVGEQLFFSAWDSTSGEALWRLPLKAGEPDGSSGCGCSVPPGAGVGAGWALVLLGWTARRRRAAS